MPASTIHADAVDASIGEFELIERFFRRPALSDHIALGPGDDCALLQPSAGEQWAVSTDMLVEGVHFFVDVDAQALGHKALAVNLSDLAACGAKPRCFLLGLALPRIDLVWLERLSDGMYALAAAHDCVLAGGDTSRPPHGVVITITAIGTVPVGHALLRSGARVGDDVWVSGELGDAALALACKRSQFSFAPAEAQHLVMRLERPTPRVQLGEQLRRIATSAIDISDGLLGDLRHILRASKVGAQIEWARVPRSDVLRRQPVEVQHQCVLSGGDDYELLFTAPASSREAVAAAADSVAVARIGTITAAELTVVDEHGKPIETDTTSFDHFKRLAEAPNSLQTLNLVPE